MRAMRLSHTAKVRHRLLPLLVWLAIAATLCGCAGPKFAEEVPDVAQNFKPHMQQVLNNVALFTRDPGAWPSHVLVYRGAYENRGQWTGSIGTSTKLENVVYGMTRWELSNLDDPYDIRRVRLLYQWQVGHITFDQFEKDWNEIRDRQVLDGSGKPVLGPDGRPTFLALTLPITRNTRRDWTTPNLFEGLGGLAGTSGTPGLPGSVTLWVTDSEAATQFSLAILAAMANTRAAALGW